MPSTSLCHAIPSTEGHSYRTNVQLTYLSDIDYEPAFRKGSSCAILQLQSGYHKSGLAPGVNLTTLTGSDLFFSHYPTIVIPIAYFLYTSLKRWLSLARKVKEHRFDSMRYCLSSLPKGENAHHERAAKEPENANNNPACIRSVLRTTKEFYRLLSYL